MNKKLLTSLIFCGILLTFTAAPVQAQEETEPPMKELPASFFLVPENYATARVETVAPAEDFAGEENAQDVRLKILGGEEKGKVINIKHGDIVSLREDQKVSVGDEVVLTKATNGTLAEYQILDRFRLPGVALIAFLFFLAAVIFGRKKGLTSIIGLALTVAVLIYGIIPGILAGWNPFAVSLIGAGLIAAVSLYLAHGFHRRTTIALIGTGVTLIISALLAIIFVELTRLSGNGSEEAFFLQLGAGTINMKGLLLGGIIIGALGVLDDITTAQAAAVEEIHKANPKLTSKDLYSRGISVGKEHIASLVNTLVLAYAGASFPLLILFSMENLEPFWVTLNHEFMVEEIVRTLVGSTALIFAVPITTFLAARAFVKAPKRSRNA